MKKINILAGLPLIISGVLACGDEHNEVASAASSLPGVSNFSSMGMFGFLSMSLVVVVLLLLSVWLIKEIKKK